MWVHPKSIARLVLILVVVAVLSSSETACTGQDAANYNEKAMALYADAANFQTNGALELAVEGWKKYLDKYPEEDYASKAAHYLGVCYMQQAQPDYAAACDAFERSVKDSKSELREESLVNLGWCQFAAAGDGEKQDAKRLKSSLDTFKTLLKEKPTSKFADRALFYGGEAAYALGDTKTAVSFYDRLIAMDSAKDSPLRCDTYYARGVALEEMQKLDDAIKSYHQLIEGCKDEQLASDARVRIGDVLILQKKFDDAAAEFASVAGGNGPDVAYALVRQAFAHVQAGKPQDAATLYERLLSEFPDSPHAASATLASAQSIYRAGDMDEAEKRFQRVLSQSNVSAATEAAHWLATIAMRKGKPQAAQVIAQKQLDAGATGDYAMALKLDLAEALMMIPGKVAEAQKLYQAFYDARPDDPQAARALYNAAFALLQLGQTDAAIKLANDFLQRFPDNPLSPDVRYIVAESTLMGGAHAEAAEAYQALIKDPATAKNIQQPLWLLRAAMATYLAGKYDDSIELLEKQLAPSAPGPQVAEAKYIIGASHLAAGRPEPAAEALEASLAADPKWFKAGETSLLLGQALLAAGNEKGAEAVWQKLVTSSDNSARGDQARFRIAQLAAMSGDHEAAAKDYEAVAKSNRDPSLLPLALYGNGWNLLQAGRPADAVAPLERIAKEFPDHAIGDDALLALGISLRTLGKEEEASVQLTSLLEQLPAGINRGHALYELALIDQQQNRPAEAAKRLEQLVASVPNYPSMDKVIYEWAWSLKESGQDEAAIATFGQLIEKFPDNPLTAEGNYFIGQQQYEASNWKDAAQSFAAAAGATSEQGLLEKSLYRLGWSRFKTGDFDASSDAFSRQAKEFPEGKLISDALLMRGENDFKRQKYADALAAYTIARERIEANDETAKTLDDDAERQVRELVYLHGGQCAAQLKEWKTALQWYQELRKRFPETSYLPQVLYEVGLANQQLGNDDEALKWFGSVANDYRNETAAKSRFMIGEIYFGNRDLAKAIPEFQRVMYGYGADKAPEAVKNWQAKSGFEAGRCAELLIQKASDAARREKAARIAKDFFKYVIDKHPKHELAAKSQERLDVLNRMKLDTGALNTTPPTDPNRNRTKVAN